MQNKALSGHLFIIWDKSSKSSEFMGHLAIRQLFQKITSPREDPWG